MPRKPSAKRPVSKDKSAPSEIKPLPGSEVAKQEVPRHFKMIFLSVLGLTVLSLATNVALVWFKVDTPQAKSLIEACNGTWRMGFGAIIGMLVGKSAQ
jgi:hypothetical protein